MAEAIHADLPLDSAFPEPLGPAQAVHDGGHPEDAGPAQLLAKASAVYHEAGPIIEPEPAAMFRADSEPRLSERIRQIPAEELPMPKPKRKSGTEPKNKSDKRRSRALDVATPAGSSAACSEQPDLEWSASDQLRSSNTAGPEAEPAKAPADVVIPATARRVPSRFVAAAREALALPTLG